MKITQSTAFLERLGYGTALKFLRCVLTAIYRLLYRERRYASAERPFPSLAWSKINDALSRYSIREDRWLLVAGNDDRSYGRTPYADGRSARVCAG